MACRFAVPRICGDIAQAGNGGNKIICLGVQQRLFAQRAGCYQAHHLAAHHGFGAALFGGCRVLGLLANGDPETGLNEALQITLTGMIWHAAHRHGLPQMRAAMGQGNVQCGGGSHGIVKKQFVKIAHAIE